MNVRVKLVWVDVTPSLKVHEVLVGAFVEVLLNQIALFVRRMSALVKIAPSAAESVVLNWKFATGTAVGPTWMVMNAELEPPLFVAVNWTWYVPADWKTWVTFREVDCCPSPKVQSQLVACLFASVLELSTKATLKGATPVRVGPGDTAVASTVFAVKLAMGASGPVTVIGCETVLLPAEFVAVRLTM
ncbi:hypothetical protein DSECCO2_426180 [anaerobic digester metagenome]